MSCTFDEIPPCRVAVRGHNFNQGSSTAVSHICSETHTRLVYIRLTLFFTLNKATDTLLGGDLRGPPLGFSPSPQELHEKVLMVATALSLVQLDMFHVGYL